MTNKWIEHVKTEAKNKKMSYGCALTNSDIKNNYTKIIKKTKIEKDIIKKQIITNQAIKILKNKIKNINNVDIPVIRMKYNSYSQNIKDGFKDKYPNYYKKLFN